MPTPNARALTPSHRQLSLKEANETIYPPSQDIRGRDVVAADGTTIGTVGALFIDVAEAKIRYLRIDAKENLGDRAAVFMLPVDAIASVDKDHVHVNEARAKIFGSPIYDPRVVAKNSDAYNRKLFDYYGYGPYWAVGYEYPF
ncbi:MAG: PRC-barrel domain-containing protein [Opitutaceae bacterium]